MLKKPTKCQLVWMLLVVTNTVCSAVSSCNTTIMTRTSGKIAINSSHCTWKIVFLDGVRLSLSFSDFTLKDCAECKCEYVEIWSSDSKDPKYNAGRFCGSMKNQRIFIDSKYALVEYTSGLIDRPRFLYYTHDDGPHTDNDDKHRHDHPESVITTTAIGILLSLVILIGTLACGVCLVQYVRPKPRRRRSPAVLQTPVLQTPITTELPKLPHLPNYFDNDSAVPPPYLDTIGTDGNPVPPPAYYDNPPQYSILDTESTLETTGDTRASDRLDQTQ